MNATKQTYSISDNTDTIEVQAESVTSAVLELTWDDATALIVTDEAGEEYYVIRHPGTADTDEEIGDDPRVECVRGYGSIETDWMPLWQRQ